MGVLIVRIKTAKDDETLDRDYQLSDSAKYVCVQRIVQLLQGILSGNEGGSPPEVSVAVEGDETPATGTFTLDTVIATDACSINGVSFACVASGATGNQFNVGADDEETAANLAAAINASLSALVNEFVTAEAVDEVVTLTAKVPGTEGNSVTIASADATIVASGARLTGGAEDSDAKVYSF